jgi:hypothetical protein
MSTWLAWGMIGNRKNSQYNLTINWNVLQQREMMRGSRYNHACSELFDSFETFRQINRVIQSSLVQVLLISNAWNSSQWTQSSFWIYQATSGWSRWSPQPQSADDCPINPDLMLHTTFLHAHLRIIGLHFVEWGRQQRQMRSIKRSISASSNHRWHSWNYLHKS